MEYSFEICDIQIINIHLCGKAIVWLLLLHNGEYFLNYLDSKLLLVSALQLHTQLIG